MVFDEQAPLACPRCAGPLLRGDENLTCASCARSFPFIGGIPCLMDDAMLWRALWSSRLHEYLDLMDKRVFFLRQELELRDRLPRTRERLAMLAAGLEDQRNEVATLMQPFGAGALAIPSRPEARETPALLEFYANIFRDWAWGSIEIDRSRALVEPSLAEGVGTLAIYGAGAGRLAVDLHRSRRPKRTFALDVNPLPLLVADALVRGETVELPELPVAPHSREQVVVRHRLKALEPVGEGFEWIFADALRPPFAPASLDVVLTSWFIDAVPADVRVTAAAINRVLRPGGLWLNLGPLRFRTELARQYSIEEIHDLVQASSFEMRSTSRHDVPYFDSPLSGSRRIETVFFFCAAKTGETTIQEIPRPVAPWIADPRVPIPITPPLIALGKTSVFTASMLGLVDGTRSMIDVAEELGRTWQVDPSILLDQLRAFFAKLPE